MGVGGKELWSQVAQDWPSYLLNLSKTQFSLLWNGDRSDSHHREVLWGWNELIHIKHLGWCLAQNKHCKTVMSSAPSLLSSNYSFSTCPALTSNQPFTEKHPLNRNSRATTVSFSFKTRMSHIIFRIQCKMKMHFIWTGAPGSKLRISRRCTDRALNGAQDPCEIQGLVRLHKPKGQSQNLGCQPPCPSPSAGPACSWSDGEEEL